MVTTTPPPVTYSGINGPGTGSPIPTGGSAGTPQGNIIAQPSSVNGVPVTPTSMPPNTVQSTSGFPVSPGSSDATTSTTVPTGSSSVVQPPLQPQSEDEIYAGMVSQGQSIIDEINASTQAQIQAANAQIDQASATAQQNQNGLAAITGGFGSSSVAGASGIASTAASEKTTADNTATAQGAQQLATYLQSLQTAATSQANYEQSTAFSQGQTYQTYLVTQANQTLQGMAAQGVTLQTLQTQAQSGNTVAQTALNNLLQAYGGDQNALNAAAALATPAPTVAQAWTQGSTYYQIVKNPQTGAVSLQQFDLGTTIPQGATVQKVSTTSSLLTLPDGSIISLTTNPLTGALSASGGGTAAAQTIINQINSQSGSSGSSSTGTSTSTGTDSTGYISTATTTAGISDPTTPFSTAVSNVGIGSLVNGVIQAEGGSYAGVQNNPGNVKYVAGMPGATDSGVAATGPGGGGTYANFATPQAGQQAIASTLQTIAQNQGANATVQSVLSTYADLGAGSSTPTSGAGSQYGTLTSANTTAALQAEGAPAFNPTPGSVDADALNYITNYLSTGTVPSTSGMGGVASLGAKNEIQSRAEQLYFAATGQQLLSPTTQNNIQMIQGNESLLNTLGINAPTIASNANLLIGKINGANINQNAPAINAIIDPIIQALGNVPVAALNAQTSTLGNELGSLLALKNAGGSGGSTVHDKLMAAGLITADSTAGQEADVVNTILQEAVNAQGAIANQTLNLYQQTDPANLMGGNPMNNPDYSTLTGAGMTWMGGNTYQAPDGSMYNVSAQGDVTPIQSDAVSSTSTTQ